MTTYRFVSPVPGVPARSPAHGSLGWSSVTLLVGADDVVVVDTGGPGYRANWDGWLAAEGLSRHDVTTVLLTHGHWDHLGAASWFPAATIGVGRTELDWGAGADDPYVEPWLFAGVRSARRLTALEDGDVVAGIRAVTTPGHTPGHLSYAVSTTDGPLLVVGDAVKNATELAGGPFDLTMDRDASVASRERVRSMARDGFRLCLGHDGIYSAGLTAAPPVTAVVELTAPAEMAVRGCG